MLIPKRNLSISSPRRGFTLVELMVTIVITMIMMFIFARVFAMTTGSMVRMHAIGENDERARTLTTILKEDLKSRTFRSVVPWRHNEAAAADYTTITRPDLTSAEIAKANLDELLDSEKRKGYLYISDNDPDLDNDDVLQFTVDIKQRPNYDDLGTKPTYYGKAAQIGSNTDLNQPIWDDFTDDPNPNRGIGSSELAEISYFLRNGVLYRRILLARKPIDTDGNPTTVTPRDDAGTTDLITGDYDVATDAEDNTPTTSGESDFWNDFDYSAFYNSGPQFNGTGSINDSFDNSVTASTIALGRPYTRFGFDHTSANPREYIQEASATPIFIGRFTHEETSYEDFGYPGRLPAAGSPFSDASLDDSDSDGVVDVANVNWNGPRRGEDILLTNVVSFDIKLWDDELNKFVDIGNNDAVRGSFNISKVNPHFDTAIPPANTINNYGPNGSPNNVFDTWHPEYDYDGGASGFDPPPYRPDDGYEDSSDPSDATKDRYAIPKAVRAIQITIRYYDTRSQSTRQLTIEQSLID